MKRICAVALLLLLALPLDALEPVFAVRLAIFGYDPVAYFTDAEPAQGHPKYQHEWQGARWLFANAENRDAFKAEPEKYAPQYGGYCAYAVSLNKTAKIDPLAWKIVDGKLYLNYDPRIQMKWEKNQAERIEKADANWAAMLTEGGE